jgi:hypothetical protein
MLVYKDAKLNVNIQIKRYTGGARVITYPVMIWKNLIEIKLNVNVQRG